MFLNLRFHFESFLEIIIFLKCGLWNSWLALSMKYLFIVQVMFSSSLCWEFNFSFQIIDVHLIHKNKGSRGQVRFALWYPISIDDFVINLFLTPLPNEFDTSSFYLYYLDLSGYAVPIQPNKQTKQTPALNN